MMEEVLVIISGDPVAEQFQMSVYHRSMQGELTEINILQAFSFRHLDSAGISCLQEKALLFSIPPTLCWF